MKAFLKFLIFASFLTNVYSQEIGVPYRVGKKFGISNKAGKLFITPDYDLITPDLNGNDPYYRCYKFNGNELLSSLIYKNKIVIKDKPYHTYYKEGHFFKAYTYVPKQKKSRTLNSVDEFTTLYDVTGKKVFEQEFKSISSITEIDKKSVLKEVLLLSTDMNNLYSLFVYDLKLKKITRTFFEKSTYLEIRYNNEYWPNDNSILVTYTDNTNKGMQSKIDVVNKQIKAVESKPFTINNRKERYNNDDVLVIPERDMPKSAPEDVHKKSNEWRSIDTKHKFYWELSKPEEITLRKEVIQPNDGYLIIENNKVGFFNEGYNKIMVPIKYDEIYKASFSGRNGGYVLRNENKYGLFIYDYPNNKTIEPVFDKVPLLIDYNYFKPKDPLIKIYDENGLFFCYANGEGILYYSEK